MGTIKARNIGDYVSKKLYLCPVRVRHHWVLDSNTKIWTCKYCRWSTSGWGDPYKSLSLKNPPHKDTTIVINTGG